MKWKVNSERLNRESLWESTWEESEKDVGNQPGLYIVFFTRKCVENEAKEKVM